MNNFKKYNYILLSIYILVLILLCGLAAYMRPLTGDLTRLGGYLENSYGWETPQLEFSESLYKQSFSISEYDRYYDVVVIGDSFSRRPLNGWQNYLVNSTGYSLISFDWEKTQPEEILSSETFRKYPPKIFIYESIEHGLYLRNSHCNETAGKQLAANFDSSSPDPITGLGLTPHLVEPEANAIQEGKFDVGSAANYFVKSFARNVLGMNITFVKKYELTRDDLFSNKEKSQILIHKRRFLKASVGDSDIETIQCNLLRIQAQTQSNKTTHFIVMPIPDKLSAYSEYLVDQTHSDISFIQKIPTNGLNIVQLDQAFGKVIDQGIKDVYLPNDTHWGSVGYKLAADTIMAYLVEQRIVKPQ